MYRFRNLLFAGLSLAALSANAATEINYWLWDALQLPAYKAAAEAFEKANPDIKVKITQTAWGDYWTTLSTGFVSGTTRMSRMIWPSCNPRDGRWPPPARVNAKCISRETSLE